jgi:hypothetical protein
MKHLGAIAALITLALVTTPEPARAQSKPGGGCVLDGVRLLVADAGENAIVELSVRVSAAEGVDTAVCSIPWDAVAIGAPTPQGSPPSVAVIRTFVDHAPSSLQLADGVGSAMIRGWEGPVTRTPIVVALRLLVEGTGDGLSIDVPRAALPVAAVSGARFEQRVKSARGGAATFSMANDDGALEPLGDAMAIVPTDAGPANGVGPASALPAHRARLTFAPNGSAPSATIPPSLLTLELLRASIPKRALELSPANAEGWDQLATAAYAAALHGDPVVATLGAGTLAWLGSGLSTHAIDIGETAALPDRIAVPGSVAAAIGDAPARITRRFGTRTRLLPLGRPSTFRAAMRAELSADEARATAAKQAVARLAARSSAELARTLPAAIIDDVAPTDPPRAEVLQAQMPTAAASTLAPAPMPKEPGPSTAHRSLPRRGGRHRGLLGLLALVGLAGLAAALRAEAFGPARE